ncbi:alpha/beta hydrolase [Salipaludibacillus sp. CUR1]|uniref:alpha/beta fold hydrolase n=1 Tax=Salipaludibacillus sp. CUR1 TaxID=2820003 RepID=UPI001E633F3B|nr:alpha/beta hydrolase [Salipaludibacillus sp. CUR1]MCE7790964.1 alpha/beta hydrolase [Salipaludibacillus sp. CUR1]
MGEKLKKEMHTIDGMEIYCEHDFNGRPPILLLHGFLSSTYTFHRVIPILQRNFSVLAIDLPGFGKSEKCQSFIYSYYNYGRFVKSCADYFKLDKLSIAGHSMGGQIALNAVRVMPERIEAVVLLGSSGYLQKSRRLWIYSSYLPFFDRLISAYIHKRGVLNGLKNVLHDPSIITDEHVEEFGRPLAEKEFYKVLCRLLRYREGDLTSKQLKDIKVKALLLWGKEDRVVPVHIGNKLAEDLPHAEMITFNQTGHLLTEERPKEVCEAIISHCCPT